MKTFYSFLLLALFSLSGYSQIINIPDANFKARLLAANTSSEIAKDINGNFIVIDSNNDDEIQISEALLVYSLNVVLQNINNLTGIENFTNLQHIQCQNNQLINLPFSNLINLKEIYCNDNLIASLSEIENLTQLKKIWFSSNQVVSFNLQNLSQLENIQCSDNLLTEINLCGTSVKLLWCQNNPNLHSLYLKNNVISNDFIYRQIPPPLHSFEFYNSPLLNFICYDEGEYDAVYSSLGYNTIGKTLVTSCDANCILTAPEFEISAFFNLYPNPAKNMLNIAAKEAISIQSINIYNNLGQLVQSVPNQNLGNTIAIDVSKLQSGHYFVNIISDKGKTTAKFIKN
jgi:hypothetical protein